jgi:hypothetical protein
MMPPLFRTIAAAALNIDIATAAAVTTAANCTAFDAAAAGRLRRCLLASGVRGGGQRR